MTGEAWIGGGTVGEGPSWHSMFVQIHLSLLPRNVSSCLGFYYFMGSARLNPGPQACKAITSLIV